MADENTDPPRERVVASFDATRLFPVSRHFNVLLRTARSLVDRQPEAAIATAQMAFESFTAFAFELLLRTHGLKPDLSQNLSSVVTASLMDRPTRDLWAHLTGRELSTAPGRAWAAYTKHVERRNKMVHAGGRATASEATASIDAVEALMDAMIEMGRNAAAKVTQEMEPGSTEH